MDNVVILEGSGDLSGSHCAIPVQNKVTMNHCASDWLSFPPYLVYRKIITLNRYQKVKTLFRARASAD